MALTTDQQAQVDMTVAMDAARHANNLTIQSKQAKLEAVRLAQQTLIENARSKAVDSRDVSAADIAAFAQTLVAYIDA
jgi:autotransporter adhesin